MQTCLISKAVKLFAATLSSSLRHSSHFPGLPHPTQYSTNVRPCSRHLSTHQWARGPPEAGGHRKRQTAEIKYRMGGLSQINERVALGVAEAWRRYQRDADKWFTFTVECLLRIGHKSCTDWSYITLFTIHLSLSSVPCGYCSSLPPLIHSSMSFWIYQPFWWNMFWRKSSYRVVSGKFGLV